MPSKTFILILALLLSLNGPSNSSPSITLTNANSQSWAMVFGSPTADSTKAARVDITLTSQYLFKTQYSNVGAICAVTDTSGALSVADHNAFSIEFTCPYTNVCADISSKVTLSIFHGILTSTGSAFNFAFTGGIGLSPTLDYSMTGTGTSGDPYVWSLGFEFTSSQTTVYHIPTSTQFLTCWANPDTRVSSDMAKSWNDLGNTAGFVTNTSITTSTPSTPSTPSSSNPNTKSDALSFSVFKKGLVMAVIFVSQQIG